MDHLVIGRRAGKPEQGPVPFAEGKPAKDDAKEEDAVDSVCGLR